MDMKNFCNSGAEEPTGWRPMMRQAERSSYERVVSVDVVDPGPKGARWRLLWRKIKTQRKKILCRSSSAAAQFHVPYDIHTYSQNFARDSTWDDDDDPDCFSRSFSARFALPTRIFDDRDLVIM